MLTTKECSHMLLQIQIEHMLYNYNVHSDLFNPENLAITNHYNTMFVCSENVYIIR